MTSTLTDKELARLVARHYEILKELYSREYYLSELALKLGRDAGSLSKSITKLEDAGLIMIREESRDEGGRAFKFCQLTDESKGIIASFAQATQPTLVEPEPAKPSMLSKEKFDEVLERVKNPRTRKLAIEVLEKITYGRILMSIEPIDKVLEALKDPTFDQIRSRLYSILKSLCVGARKGGILSENKLYRIADLMCSIITHHAVDANEVRQAFRIWKTLETKHGQDILLNYCWKTVETMDEEKYEKEFKSFIQDVMEGILDDKEKKRMAREKIWRLIAESEDEKVRKRYEELLYHPIGLVDED